MTETLRAELEQHLAEPLHYVGKQARHFVLDALACHMHNKGYFIEGCKEENDARWLARNLWAKFDERPVKHGKFENQSSDEQERWVKIARSAISCLPSLMSRVANRAIHYSQALRDMERGLRIEMEKLEKARLKTKFIGNETTPAIPPV